MEKKYITIHFQSIKDFRSRIGNLWLDQKEGEVFDFTFENKEIEDEYLNLIKCFTCEKV
jgi:hypothetical protein